MKLLLDTCSFLWATGDSASLSEHARELFTDPGDDLYLSAVSTWEISVEHALGKQPLSEPPDRLIPEMRKRHGVSPLPLEEKWTPCTGRGCPRSTGIRSTACSCVGLW